MLHVQARVEEVEVLNADLTARLADIDTVLEFTLGVDDHVDLETLRLTADHPPFTSPHETPIPPPAPIGPPTQPQWVPPVKKGMFGMKKFRAEVAAARETYERRLRDWQEKVDAIPARQLQRAQDHAEKETARQVSLEADRAAYGVECKNRQEDVDAHNADLDQLIADLAAGRKGAIEEYFAIVLSNSVYPDDVDVETEHSYDPTSRELEVSIGLPQPADLPTVRSYRYVKARDEITETQQPAKEQKDRYNALVHAIVIRTLHEIWESDRTRHVDTISLTASVTHIDPATGNPTTTPIVAAAVARTDFEQLDLANITPAETLKHLKVEISKNPHALAPISTAKGVRG